MEHSRSPADLSTDEAHGEVHKRSIMVDDDVETSTAEARERQNSQSSLVSFQIFVFYLMNYYLLKFC